MSVWCQLKAHRLTCSILRRDVPLHRAAIMHEDLSARDAPLYRDLGGPCQCLLVDSEGADGKSKSRRGKEQ